MPTIIVVSTSEDQAKIAKGIDPDVSNMYSRYFETELEARAYQDGLNSLPDCISSEILEDNGLKMLISFAGEEKNIEFSNDAEKIAYLDGLDDADGFVSPAIYEEGDEGYEALLNLISSQQMSP